jgi:hypothetical protein
MSCVRGSWRDYGQRRATFLDNAEEKDEARRSGPVVIVRDARNEACSCRGEVMPVRPRAH